MEKVTIKKQGRAGRPTGTVKTEHSTLVARTRAATGDPPMTQEAFARELGCATSTLRRYELQSLIPTDGAVRRAIIQKAKKLSVPIEEPQAA